MQPCFNDPTSTVRLSCQLSPSPFVFPSTRPDSRAVLKHHVQTIPRRVVQHLKKLDDVWMMQFFENGQLVANQMEWIFALLGLCLFESLGFDDIAPTGIDVSLVSFGCFAIAPASCCACTAFAWPGAARGSIRYLQSIGPQPSSAPWPPRQIRGTMCLSQPCLAEFLDRLQKHGEWGMFEERKLSVSATVVLKVACHVTERRVYAHVQRFHSDHRPVQPCARSHRRLGQ